MKDPSARTLAAGELEAVFLPGPGMLGTPLREIDLDDRFTLLAEPTSFALAGAGRRISVELLAGYRYAQVFAPKDKDYVALEPTTASANALASDRGLQLVEPGGELRAAFRIRVDADRAA